MNINQIIDIKNNIKLEIIRATTIAITIVGAITIIVNQKALIQTIHTSFFTTK